MRSVLGVALESICAHSQSREPGENIGINATTSYLDDFRARGEAIAEACTRCGDCFRACPMVEPAGLGEAEPEATAGGIIDLITGGTGTPEAVR